MEMAITLLITAMYVLLVKIFFNAEKLFLWIKQRTKKEEPQLSKAVIDNTKMAALVTIIMINKYKCRDKELSISKQCSQTPLW